MNNEIQKPEIKNSKRSPIRRVIGQFALATTIFGATIGAIGSSEQAPVKPEAPAVEAPTSVEYSTNEQGDLIETMTIDGQKVSISAKTVEAPGNKAVLIDPKTETAGQGPVEIGEPVVITNQEQPR